MLDKNGAEMKTGCIVRITGAFFKNDNRLYLVEHSPGDADWCASDHSLKKISKAGKISTAKHNLCFWPIGVFISNRQKTAERRFGKLFYPLFKSITVDNGCEFQDFEGIEIAHRRKGKRTYVFFCHPYSAYERGSNENMNWLIRRFFPKGTNFD